jgi:hypothetical protein
VNANETPRGNGALENLLGGGSGTDSTAAAFLAGKTHPHELPWELWLIWSDGFRAGCDRMQARADEAEHGADYWYLRAHHTPAEIEQMRLDAMDDAWRTYWDAGMPTEVSA